jgi:hypothetical protein
MDLWTTLGVSREAGTLAVVVVVAVVSVVAGRLFRRSRRRERIVVDLNGRD